GIRSGLEKRLVQAVPVDLLTRAVTEADELAEVEMGVVGAAVRAGSHSLLTKEDAAEGLEGVLFYLPAPIRKHGGSDLDPGLEFAYHLAGFAVLAAGWASQGNKGRRGGIRRNAPH